MSEKRTIEVRSSMAAMAISNKWNARNLSACFSELLAGAARALLLAVLLTSPWLFGGAEYSHQRWLYAGVVVALGLWLASFLLESGLPRNFEYAIPTILAPVVAAQLLGGIQILPGLPQLVPWLQRAELRRSNEVAEQHASLGQMSPLVASELAQREQLSLYPASTRLELGRLAIGTCALLAGMGLFVTPRSQVVLWSVLGFNGAALAFFGIAQKLSWNEKIYWTYPLTLGGQPFASFVNRNNAAGYLNLCFATACGFAAWVFWRPGPDRAKTRAHQRTFEERRGWRERLSQIEARHLLALTLCILILSGISSSLSRGGVVAFVGGGLAGLALLASRRGTGVAAWSVGGAVVLCAIVLGSVGLSGKFTDRISTLFDEQVRADARWTNWHDAWRATQDFPILGTGMGSYRYAYQPYQVRPSSVWFYNADNHYVEGMTEAGGGGLLLIGACAFLMLRATWELIHRRGHSENEVLAYVSVFALVSQFIHAGFDYGISVPANLITFATICGVIVAEAARRTGGGPPPLSIAIPLWRPRFVVALLGLMMLLNGGLAIREVAGAAATKSARSGLPDLNTPDSLKKSQLETALKAADSALRGRKDDAELHQTLADLWIYRYRQQTLHKLERRYALDREKITSAPNWGMTELAALHRYANEAYRVGDFRALGILRETDVVKENLVPARTHLKAAQAACRLLPRVDLKLATLAFLVDDDPSGLAVLERAVGLSPTDEDVLFRAGQLAQNAARMELAQGYWRRCLALGTKHREAIFTAIVDKISLSDLLEQLLPPSPEILLDFARTRLAAAKDRRECQMLVTRAKLLLDERHSPLAEPDRLYWSAVAERLEGRIADAISLYRRAIVLKPDAIEWRLELVGAFREAGQLDNAVREVRWCSWMAPDHPRVQSVHREIVRQQLAGSRSDALPSESNK